MEMSSSFGGDMHEFCLVVIKLKLKRALSSAGFNAVLEPVGLDRGDG